MPRLSLMAILLSMCLAIAILAMLLPGQSKHNITPAGYDQLKLGMSLEEVEQLLGVPAGDYGPGKGEILEFGAFSMTGALIKSNPTKKVWLAGDFAITVSFDEKGRMDGKMTEAVHRPYDSTTQMILQRIGLREEKPYPPGSFNAWLHPSS